MSKYKYSSLLSSQYRQLFKSYHSLDRYQKQLNDHKYKNTHKRINSSFQNFNTKNDIYSSLNNIKKQSSNIRKPQTYLYYKTKPQYKSYNQKIKIRTQQNQSSVKYGRQNLIKNQIQIKYDKNYNLMQKQRQINNKYLQMIPFDKQNKDNIYGTSFANKNNELKMKVSQINRRRNQCRLKVRVDDIDRINKKYDYLQQENLKLTTQANQFKINTEKQNIYRKSNTYYDQQQENKYISIISKQNMDNSINNQRIPLNNINQNKMSLNNINIKNRNKQINSNRNRNVISIRNNQNQQQNIQTPHFHQTQNKYQHIITPNLIQMKLQNLVKNTFTDRY